MDAEAQLQAFIDRYDPAVAALGRAARAKMRALLPMAFELVYDNYNALAWGYAASERAGDVAVSLALYPRWVTLFFLNGAPLTDPTGRLVGKGSQVRSIRLETAEVLDEPDVVALIEDAVAAAKKPLTPVQGRVVIKSISAKQRPRRPA